MVPDPSTVSEQQPSGLSLTVVQYADTPDRCTIHPIDASGDAQLTTWLSADRDAFVSLESVR